MKRESMGQCVARIDERLQSDEFWLGYYLAEVERLSEQLKSEPENQERLQARIQRNQKMVGVLTNRLKAQKAS